MSRLVLPGMQDDYERVAFDRLNLSQWFTPPWLAERIAIWTAQKYLGGRIPSEARILEPSAGAGRLVYPLIELGANPANMVVNDIDPKWVETLRDCLPDSATVTNHDYVRRDYGTEHFDICVANPPYENGLDGMFLSRAMDMSDRVIALVRTVALHGKERHELVWRRVTLGEFHLRGIAYLTARPDFGGEHGAQADFVVIDLDREAGATEVAWWT